MEEETNSDWSEEYKGDRPNTDSKWFSDVVPEGELSFKANITFKSEGEKATNNFGKQVIRFTIEVDGEEKTMEIGANQYDYLKCIAEAKPVTGKTATHERTGVGQKDTRRKIKFS